MPKIKATLKKRNPQDATRRNVQAVNRKLAVHAQAIRDLTRRVDALEETQILTDPTQPAEPVPGADRP